MLLVVVAPPPDEAAMVLAGTVLVGSTVAPGGVGRALLPLLHEASVTTVHRAAALI
jgi:hypothetical protein